MQPEYHTEVVAIEGLEHAVGKENAPLSAEALAKYFKCLFDPIQQPGAN